MQTTIGQGNTLVSPLHMCMIAGAICNDGNLMRPYLVDHTENASGALVEQNKPASYKQIMSKDQAAFLQNLMAAVVSDGTGAKLSDQSYMRLWKDRNCPGIRFYRPDQCLVCGLWKKGWLQ